MEGTRETTGGKVEKRKRIWWIDRLGVRGAARVSPDCQAWADESQNRHGCRLSELRLNHCPFYIVEAKACTFVSN